MSQGTRQSLHRRTSVVAKHLACPRSILSHRDVHFVKKHAKRVTALSMSGRALRAPYKIFIKILAATGANLPLSSAMAGEGDASLATLSFPAARVAFCIFLLAS